VLRRLGRAPLEAVHRRVLRAGEPGALLFAGQAVHGRTERPRAEESRGDRNCRRQAAEDDSEHLRLEEGRGLAEAVSRLWFMKQPPSARESKGIPGLSFRRRGGETGYTRLT